MFSHLRSEPPGSMRTPLPTSQRFKGVIGSVSENMTLTVRSVSHEVKM